MTKDAKTDATPATVTDDVLDKDGAAYSPDGEVDGEDLDMDALGDFLDGADAPEGEDADPDHREEDPDDQDPDLDEDDADEGEPEGDPEEDPEAEAGPKTIAEMEARIGKVTRKFKEAEERAAALEKQLEEREEELARVQLAEPAEGSQARFATVREIEQRAAGLRKLLPSLEAEVDGVPAWERDEVSGERKPATVEIEGKEYEVRHVRARIRDLKAELDVDLPAERKRLELRAKAEATAKKLMPTAFQRGTPAFEARKALLREDPSLRNLPETRIVEILLGRAALDARKRRGAASLRKPAPAKPGLRSSAGADGGRSPKAPKKDWDKSNKEASDLADFLDEA